jgi:ABC-type amino acid transport substrate-binding protein
MLGNNAVGSSSSSAKLKLNLKTIVVSYSEDGNAFQLRRNLQTGLLEMVEVGAEYFILKALARSMNFSVHVTTPADRQWGARTENGSFNGMVGQVASGEADMAIGRISLTEDRKTVVDFSYVYGTEDAGFAMRRPERVHGAFAFLRIFSKQVRREPLAFREALAVKPHIRDLFTQMESVGIIEDVSQLAGHATLSSPIGDPPFICSLHVLKLQQESPVSSRSDHT